MKMYSVEAKCGHVGRNHFVIKCFAIKAESGKEAAKIVRDLPRVKHHHKDAIISVTEISFAEYCALINNNNSDPYFKCSCVQDQRKYQEENILDEIRPVKYGAREENIKNVYYGKKLLRNPKKFMKNVYQTERYVA